MEWLSWLYVLFLLCGTRQFICCSSSSSLNSSLTPFPYQHFCNPDDSSALLQFKDSFLVNASLATWNCDSVYFKTVSWDQKSKDCCKWIGITCERVTGHVIGLDLSCSGLQGSIHHNSSLFRLSHLQRLSLSNNDFSGSPVSSNFGRFVSLTNLDLSFSNFSGHIPLELSHLSRLVSLNLSTYDKPYYLRLETLSLKRIVQNLTDLRELALDNIDMSSLLPDSFMNLTFSLTHLSLYDCRLHGQFPWSLLLKLDQLVFLDLSRNNFVGQLPEVHSNSTTNISSSLYDFFNKKPEPAVLIPLQLQILSLSDNSFSGAIPSWIYSLPYLDFLSLHNNQFTGSISKFQSTSLMYLDLSYNKLHGQIPISIFELPNLSLLGLDANNLSGVVEFDKLDNLQRLEFLLLSYNHLSVSFNNFSNSSWPNITSLHLSSCNISEFPYILRYSPQLISLDLSYNQLQGKVPTWFLDLGKDTFTTGKLAYSHHP